MTTQTKMEFAVQMTCQHCVDSIKSKLQSVNDIKVLEINLADERVILQTSLPSSQVLEVIEDTGKRAVLIGHGSASSAIGREHLGAAVTMLEEGQLKGVIRFVQSDRNKCIIEGIVDGLKPKSIHAINIHEFGDISDGCTSCGDHFNPYEQPHGAPTDEARHVGDLGNITSNENGRAAFTIEDNLVKVWDIIGRSVVIHSGADDMGRSNDGCSKTNGNSGSGLACGIIARSAGLFQNTKKFCACDGVTIWDERNVPLAGSGRRRPPQSAL
ncbi:copper chaperone for superoxide dismutase-like [Saccoglossus kowalevskii]|uniref:Superoxide dismutase copper chaperone n=1 Tax=Saccoglossus kowalevskii TaxID=10224 RepID=A0ABM0MFW3_SACKO|nr:PREDICTED: copper chaperone for superoxide dismutase-like [Saccoglossus kowalevskii]